MGGTPSNTPSPGPQPPHGPLGPGRVAQTATGYDFFMGRYSRPLAEIIATRARLSSNDRVLDVGSGPGAMTAAALRHVDPGNCWACDPSPDFVRENARLNPGANVRQGRAESLPYPDQSFEQVFASLVLHFVTEPADAIAEMRRVLAPGGHLTLSTWASQEGPQMLSAFSAAVDDAAGSGTSASAGLAVLRFGAQGDLSGLLHSAGGERVSEDLITVSSDYASFSELWAGFVAGGGPPGAYTVALEPDAQEALRRALWRRLGSPAGPFNLTAGARVASARVGSAPGG